MNTPILEVLSPHGSITRVPIPEGATISVGRVPGAQARIDDPSVSATHATLTNRAGTVSVIDCESTNGTMVNGQRIDAECVLQNDDVIAFGNSRATFRDPLSTAGIAEYGVDTQPTALEWGEALGFELPIEQRGEGSATPSPPNLQSVPLASAPADDPVARASHGAPWSTATEEPGPTTRQVRNIRLGGVVTRVRTPEPNGNPIFSMEVRTVEGDTVDVRRAFAFPFGVPHVSDGHQVSVQGRVKSTGHVVPLSIENHTTGVIWRSRRSRWVVVLAIVAVLALLTLLGVLAGFAAILNWILNVPSYGASGGTGLLLSWSGD